VREVASLAYRYDRIRPVIPMAKPRAQTTFSEDDALSWSKAGPYATRLSSGARTVVAHGATAEESERRAARLWETRDKQLAEAARHGPDEGLRLLSRMTPQVTSSGWRKHGSGGARRTA
jgi:hypothetical protein